MTFLLELIVLAVNFSEHCEVAFEHGIYRYWDWVGWGEWSAGIAVAMELLEATQPEILLSWTGKIVVSATMGC